MRSVVVVLPASMCAMMPMLRVLASVSATPSVPGFVAVAVLMLFLASCQDPLRLEASIVRKGAIRLSHAMGVLAPFDCGPGVVECVEQLIGQFLLHRLARARPRRKQQPAHRERLPARAFDLNR